MILSVKGKTPKIAGTAFIAPSAVIIGDVEIGEHCSVYWGSVIRADTDSIKIGNNSNIQENCVLHTDEGCPIIIGEGVTVGHSVVIHGSRIDDKCIIGMGSVFLNNAHIGDHNFVAAGSLITGGFTSPSNSLVLGSPAAVKRPVTQAELDLFEYAAEMYVTEGAEFAEQLK